MQNNGDFKLSAGIGQQLFCRNVIILLLGAEYPQFHAVYNFSYHSLRVIIDILPARSSRNYINDASYTLYFAYNAAMGLP